MSALYCERTCGTQSRIAACAQLDVVALIERRRQFVRAFIGGSTVRPETGVLDLQMKKLPALLPWNFTCEMIAGARYVPVQMKLQPLSRYLAGLRWAA